MARKFLDKSIDFGIGLFNNSKEKIEKFVSEMVDKGELASGDAKKVIDELVNQVEKEKDGFKKFVKENIKESIDMSEYVKKDEIRSIIKDELKNMFPDK